MRERTKGQALLLVLLSVAVVLTVALSSLSRSITDISVSTREDESLRAFSAAEAGVENALIIGNTSDTFENQSSFTSSVVNISEAKSTYNIPSELLSGETATVWFVQHSSSGDLTCSSGGCFTGNSLNLCWGANEASASEATTPAVEISIFYDPTGAGISSGNFSGVRVARATYDPNSPPSGTRTSTNNFSPASSAGCTIDSEQYQFSTGNIDLSSLGIGCTASQGCLINAQVKLLYNSSAAPVGIDVSSSASLLPSQGKKIESVGTAGESTRKIEVFQTFAQLPPTFSSAIFSPQGVTK